MLAGWWVLKMLGLLFLSNSIGAYIVPIVNTALKKIRALICSMKFLFAEVALYIYKSTIPFCNEYCCHVFILVIIRLQKLKHTTEPRQQYYVLLGGN